MLYKTRCKYTPVRSAESIQDSDGLVKQSARPCGLAVAEQSQLGFLFAWKLLEIPQVRARQGTNRLKNAVYSGVNEHYEPIYNAESCRLRDLKTAP